MRAHHVIESVHIDGGAFFRDVRFAFSDALNCVFGGTGVGKSGLLLSLRYALGTTPPAKYAKEYDEMIEATLGGGELVVSVRTKNGIRYTCKRRYGEPPRVYDERGEVAHVSLDGDLFKIEAYGQGALDGIAKSREAQLALLDGFAEEKTRLLEVEISSLDRQLAQTGDTLQRLKGDIEGEEERIADLPSVVEAIEALALEGGDDAAAIEKSNARKLERGRERIGMKAVEGAIRGARAGLDAFTLDATQKLGAAASGAGGGDVLEAARERARALAVTIEAAGETLRVAFGEASSAIEAAGRALVEAHTKEDDAYQTLVRRHEDDRIRSAERERLHRRFEELTAANKRLDDLRAARDATRAEGARLFDAREALLHERSAVREATAAEITEALHGTVRVRIERGANDDAYRAFLSAAFKGANIRPPGIVNDIAAHIRPRDLHALVEADDPTPIERADQARGGDKAARAQKIVTTLRASDRLGELETIVVGDLPHVELSVAGAYLASGKLSPGQNCTCILPIILLQSDSPLLIDQAEDNLDNGYIYEVLVKTLLRVKQNRQLLFVTHNANVPVLGDAEMSFYLELNDGAGSIGASGDVDAMHELMEAKLDGGAEAFRRRGSRYGYRIER